MLERKTQEELKELARAIIRREVFTTKHIEPKDRGYCIPRVFLPVAFAPPGTFDSAGLFYEESSKALGQGFNGYPMFTSMQLLHAEDVPLLNELVNQFEEILNKF